MKIIFCENIFSTIDLQNVNKLREYFWVWKIKYNYLYYVIHNTYNKTACHEI